MTTEQTILVGLLEAVALLVIVRLWRTEKRMSWFARLMWTAVLLVPLIGLIFYGFLRSNPDEDSEKNLTFSERAEIEHQHQD